MKTNTRTISYFLSILAIAAIFFSIEFVTEKFFYPNDEVVDILAAMIGALSFSWCKRFFDRVTDRIFFRSPRDEHAEFLTNISHELQTPIAILRGNVELLQRRSITEAERVSAERVIVGTLDGMSRLIGNILESAKLKFSKRVLHGQDITVGALLRETREDCLLLAEDRGIRLSTEVTIGGDAGEELFVRGNRDRVKEVLFNLISNAFKYTAPGGTVSLRAERAGAIARIIVEDSGCGISPEELPYIFDRFYRIESDISAVSGTGLGLNICREIIEAHGGEISAESDPGKGSCFIICLPLSPPVPVHESASAPNASSSASVIIN